MNLLDATAILIETAKTCGPEDSQTRQAIRRMEKRLRLLKLRAAKARRIRRRFAWKSLQHFAPVCRCGHRFTFGEFVSSAELNYRGWILDFHCPECRGFVVRFDKEGNRYLVDCISLHSGTAGKGQE